MHLNNIKEKYFDSLKNIFIENDFYNEELFVNILQDLRQEIYNLNLKSDGSFEEKLFYDDPKENFLFNYRNDYIEPSNYTCYKLRESGGNISTNQFSIKSRDNSSFIRDIDKNNLYINSLPNNFHYITYNSSINISTNFNNLNISFISNKNK